MGFKQLIIKYTLKNFMKFNIVYITTNSQIINILIVVVVVEKTHDYEFE